jgi:hypothetical protein
LPPEDIRALDVMLYEDTRKTSGVSKSRASGKYCGLLVSLQAMLREREARRGA